MFLFASIAVILPLFGGISVYGGASVLGVPFALALLGRNQIIVLSALSLIGAMGSYIPPVAFTPVVTAGLIGEPYLPIVRRCLGAGGRGRHPRHADPDLREPGRQVLWSVSMITVVYRGIVAVAVVLVVAELFSQRSLKLKINAGLVLIPLVLRALMIGVGYVDWTKHRRLAGRPRVEPRGGRGRRARLPRRRSGTMSSAGGPASRPCSASRRGFRASRGTNGDTDVYVLDSGKPGATALVLGGTHGNEPAGYMTAILMVENAVPAAGRLLVVPHANHRR